MRPRNKFEKAVLAESRHLRHISKRQLKWAFRFNKWTAVKPDCPFIQLTTLDENKDAKQVSLNKPKDNEQSDK